MKPKYRRHGRRVPISGIPLFSLITVCISGSAPAADSFWTGATSTDWTVGSNWNPAHAPNRDNAEDAHVNILTNFPVLTAGFGPTTPRDLFVGRGAAANGRLDMTAGNAANAGGNWVFIGVEGGTGALNITGSGSFNDTGRLWVGGSHLAGGGIGTATINTTGTVATNDFAVGSSGGTGVVNLSAGTVTSNGWNFFGKQEAAANGNGTLNISGGTFNNPGDRTYVGLGNSTGQINIASGSYNNTGTGGNAFLAVGVNNLANAATPSVNVTGGTLSVGRRLSVGGMNNGNDNTDANFIGAGKGNLTVDGTGAVVTVNGELWAGSEPNSVGVVTVNNGTVNVNNWIAVGRGGSGTITQNGGRINKTGGGSVTISNFNSAVGIYNMAGGLLDIQSGNLIVGEGGAGTAELNLTGGQINAAQVLVATGGTVVSNAELAGGTLQTSIINGAGGGTSKVNFNGTQIVATAPQNTLIANLDSGTIGAGGLKIDSNGFAVAFEQILTGSGGLVKSGAGSLLVQGGQAFTGPCSVNAGRLSLTTDFVGGGSLTVGDGAVLQVVNPIPDQQLIASEVKVGTSSGATLEFDLGPASGNASLAPLKTGNLIVNGTATINLRDALPAVGVIPLIQYTTKSGPAFVIGTLPDGMDATLVDDGAGQIYLNVNSVALPLWQGNVNGVWDVNTTPNWVDLANGNPAKFQNGSPVLFDDDVMNVGGTSDVTLNVAVAPSQVSFANSELVPYTLGGTGKITGSGSFINKGSGSVTLSTANDYTGVSTFQSGTTTIPVLTNGGAASGVGAATSDPANLVFSGGTLSTTGAAATSDRGLTVSGADNAVMSTLAIAGNLTLSGPVVAPTFGGLTKAGAGTLTLTAPANKLSAGGFRVTGGAVVLSGPGQTNTSAGLLAVGPGAGLTLNDSTLTNAGDNDFGNAGGGVGTLTLGGTSSYSSPNRIMLGIGTADTSGAAVIGGSGSVTTNAWLSVGVQGTGSLLLKDSGKLTCGDFNITDLAGSQGSFTLQDNATVTSGTTFFGKGAGSVGTATLSGGVLTAGNTYVASGGRTVDEGGNQVLAPSSGSVTQSGGVVNLAGDGGEIQIGSRGVGVWTQNAGTVNARGWTVIGRYPDVGSSGTLNLSGSAVFNQLSTGRFMIIGEETSGTVNVSGNAQINASANDGMVISHTATGIGVLNLDGGVVTAKRVRQNGGNGTLNLNGGVLRAGEGAQATFLTGLSNVNVKAGGAIVDTNGNNISFESALNDEGGTLVKNGAGTLNLNAAVNLAGLTTVNQGTLGGTALINGPVLMKTGTNLNPGDGIGAISVRGQLTFEDNTTLTIQADATGSDRLDTLALDVTKVGLVIQGTLTRAAYSIATYDTLAAGGFKSVTGLPANYQINYAWVNPETGFPEIALIRQGTAYDSWIAGYFPGVTDPAVIGASADPDHDGSTNLAEFALGGNPSQGGSGPRLYTFTADGPDTDADRELQLTFATLAGIVFTGGTAVGDGVTYTVQGSADLSGFASPVSEIIPALTTALPDPPDGYEYHTFRLDASNGLSGKGFLRVKVEP